MGDQAAPQLASDGAGGAIITWHDARTGSFDIYAQRLNAAGQPNWSGTGYLICGAAGNQGNPVIVADGAGGAILAWWDQRAGVNATDIYGMRVNSSGIPIWSTSGIISGAPNSQTNPQMVSDGAGGAIVAWEDYRNTIYSEIYSQKLSPEGVAQWTPNGVELANLGNNDYRPVLTPDGTGGAIFAWWDQRDAGDVIAQRVSASGAIQWSPTGLPVCTALFEESYPSIVSDGAGGAILAWQDQRTGGGFDIYAQRVEHFGLLGNPEPAISGVRDVPNDQGGKVRVSWAASYLDAEPTYGIAEYRLWRATPVLAALVGAGSAARRVLTTDPAEAVATGALWAPDNAGGGYAWEYVASQPAAGFAQYSLVSPTTSDSVSQSNPRTAFLVEARAGTTLTSNHWLSAPDSGYSVDNLPPGTPSSLTGGYSQGTTTLHWLPNSEGDLAGYRLYRGASANFMPDASSLVASPADTGWADPYGSPGYYKLSAVDVHGNESGFALFSPGTVDAPGGELPEGLALAPPRPNPAREDCAISGASPGSGDVALVVYDPAGRAVRELWRGVRAGPFRIKWDLKDDGGRHVPSGIYFVRLTAGSRSLTRRVVALK